MHTKLVQVDLQYCPTSARGGCCAPTVTVNEKVRCMNFMHELLEGPQKVPLMRSLRSDICRVHCRRSEGHRLTLEVTPLTFQSIDVDKTFLLFS